MKKNFAWTMLLASMLPFGNTTLAQQCPETKDLRILSYNVRNGIGIDDKKDFDRTANVIANSMADVVAIQELDSVTGRSGNLYVLKELANRALYHYTYAPAISYDGGKYGIGIMSKQKPIATRYIALPGREEARVALITEFPDYVFCCTHLSLTPEDQLLSVPLITEALKQYNKPVFLAGDLNAEPDSETMKKFADSFNVLSNTKQATYPADEPKDCIDYILALKRTTDCSVLRNGVVNAPVESDHRPLFADVKLKSDKQCIFRTQPYLQNPTDNGISVTWLTNVPTHSWVEYGTNPSQLAKAETIVNGQVISNNTIHKIRLENLQPNTTYYYKVCSKEITLYSAYHKEFGETAETEVKSFTTPPAAGEGFTAIVFNDLHQRTQLFDALYEQVKDIDYDLVMFNGDCIDDPANEDQAVATMSYINSRVGADKTPVYYTRGNHEIRNAYSMDLPKLFDYTDGKTYGAFSWGDVRIVLLDCGEDKPDDHWVYYNLNNFDALRKEQLDFLKTEMGTKAFKKAKKRVLMHHIPIYVETDKYNPCRDLWQPVLAKAPFNLAVNAHTHRFQYAEKGADQNAFPVVIGGGNTPESATVMVLQYKDNKLSLKVLNAKGDVLKETLL